MPRSQFMEWFVAQHGPRERDGSSSAASVLNATDGELKTAISQGESAAAELRRREMWDARKESAIYAWQAAHDR